MLDVDLIVAFVLMAVLFSRQFVILKEPNKLNYAPLMLGIGTISGILHFVLYLETLEMVIVLKESLMPVLVSLLLYLVMYILHQTQQMNSSKSNDEFSHLVTIQIAQLKEFISELEVRMIISRDEDIKAQEVIAEQFKRDIKVLNSIEINQNKFLDMLEKMETWHDDVESSLVKETIGSMQNMSSNITNTITDATMKKLLGVTKVFQTELLSLKSHTEGINTALYESESRLSGIREQSEMIMSQMSLSSKKMNELETQNNKLYDLYTTFTELVEDIEVIKADYVKSQSQLNSIIQDLDITTQVTRS